jgi:hypothetical protein
VGAETLGLNEIGRVRIRCLKPIVAEPYARNRATGAFVLIDALTNATVGAGMVVEPAGAGESRLGVGATRAVSPADRRRRLGHGAAVVWVAGDGEHEARALAEAIERGLFDAGLTAVAVPANTEAVRACVRAGLVAIVAADGGAVGEVRRASVNDELRAAGIPLIDLSRLSAEESPSQRALEALSAAGVV